MHGQVREDFIWYHNQEKQSKDYFHEDDLISYLNSDNCMLRPPVLLWPCLQVVIQSDDPGHFLEILTNQSSKVVIDSVMQQSSNEWNVILSTLPMNSILESPCFSLSDYDCRFRLLDTLEPAKLLWGWQADDFLYSASWLHLTWADLLNITRKGLIDVDVRDWLVQKDKLHC